MTGYFATFIQSPGDEMTAGLFIMAVALVPAMAGYATAMCAVEKNLPNSLFLWVPAVWNGLVVLGIIGLSIFGTLHG